MSRVIRLSVEVDAALERLRTEQGLKTKNAVLKGMLNMGAWVLIVTYRNGSKIACGPYMNGKKLADLVKILRAAPAIKKVEELPFYESPSIP